MEVRGKGNGEEGERGHGMCRLSEGWREMSVCMCACVQMC